MCKIYVCETLHALFNIHVLNMHPSLPPHQALLVYVCLLFICSTLSLYNIDLGERVAVFILQNVPTVLHKITIQRSVCSVVWI